MNWTTEYPIIAKFSQGKGPQCKAQPKKRWQKKRLKLLVMVYNFTWFITAALCVHSSIMPAAITMHLHELLCELANIVHVVQNWDIEFKQFTLSPREN